MSYSGTKVCAAKDCTRYFVDDRWGHIRASDEGWFIQRNGTVWCPDDIPSWVTEWRHARKSEETMSKSKKQEPINDTPSENTSGSQTGNPTAGSWNKQEPTVTDKDDKK